MDQILDWLKLTPSNPKTDLYHWVIRLQLLALFLWGYLIFDLSQNLFDSNSSEQNEFWLMAGFCLLYLTALFLWCYAHLALRANGQYKGITLVLLIFCATQFIPFMVLLMSSLAF